MVVALEVLGSRNRFHGGDLVGGGNDAPDDVQQRDGSRSSMLML